MLLISNVTICKVWFTIDFNLIFDNRTSLLLICLLIIVSWLPAVHSQVNHAIDCCQQREDSEEIQLMCSLEDIDDVYSDTFADDLSV